MFVGLLISFFPVVSEAAVTINEIAWMGTAASANHEWIELYNDGSAVDVSGWELSDGNNISILLSGTIGSGEFVVLERTSDDSAPGNAFVIYTGALSNAGATLTLRRLDGGIEDRVSGGEDWTNLGGDNESKSTAQYTTSGWITAPATPGYENETKNDEVTKASKSNSSNGSKLAEPVERESLVLELPDVTLKLDLKIPDQIFVNQQVAFDIEPTGVGRTIANSLSYTWNFGDTNTAAGKNVVHSYTYPGIYVVYVQAEFVRQSATLQKEITVLPVAISMTKNKSGDIQINNDSPYPIDISNFRLRADQVLTIPENTWLLSRQTITVPAKKLGLTEGRMIGLYDQLGSLVVSKYPEALRGAFAVENVIENEVKRVATYTYTEPVSTSDFSFTGVSSEDVEISTKEDSVDEYVEEISSVPIRTNQNNNWSMYAFVALLSLASVVVLMKPLTSKSSLDKHE